MAWIYHQADGRMERNGMLYGVGHAGHGHGKNHPGWQTVHGTGPLPRGTYHIGAPFHHPKTGADTMRLTPDSHNQMYGRDGMLIHGDNKAHLGQSSDGCIVIAPQVRQAIWGSGDRVLQVVE